MNMFDTMMNNCTESGGAFFFADYVKSGYTYRVFNYHLSSYSLFQLPYALEMRGITWLLEPGKEPAIVSRPLPKFFNYLENPFTMGLDLSKATFLEDKADGSIICTYLNKQDMSLGLKSKQAFFSTQAVMAEDFLNQPDNSGLYDSLLAWVMRDYTVTMELCSPLNRIVLEYCSTELKMHSIRHNQTGEFILPETLSENDPIRKAWVTRTALTAGVTETFIEEMRKQTLIEGVVIHGPWGRFKLKTDWYCNLHHLKDSVSSLPRLVEAILFERIDDVKAMFSTDAYTMGLIAKAEAAIFPVFTSLVNYVENFYLANRELTRKDYALKIQAENSALLPLAMNKYLGKEVQYREYCNKHSKMLFPTLETSMETE